jgi:hypothetical protein
MWYNGTSLSEKARRALENEKVTIVSHISGYIHTIYRDATIDKNAYELFLARLREFLKTDLTNLIFINFLRFKSKYKSLFQFECDCSGKKRYILLEKMFEYEHSSKFNVSAETRANLVKEIEGDEFHLSPLQGKIMLNDAEAIIDSSKGKSLKEIEDQFLKLNGHIPHEAFHSMFTELAGFIKTDPEVPDDSKNYLKTAVPVITVDDDRDKIIQSVYSHTGDSELSQLTLYAYRQMDKIDWRPFIKAAIERNPVCINELDGKTIRDVYEILTAMPDQSIYDGKRLALPDEVWNFRRGDGIEKAILLADFIHQKDNSSSISIEIEKKNIRLIYNRNEFNFHSSKSFNKTISIKGNNYTIS